MADKYMQYFNNDEIKLPEFMDSDEKYNKMIRNTDTLKKYEAIFHQLLADESLPLLDILKLMKCIEHDLILVHELYESVQLLNMTESFIKYMMTMSEDTDKTKKKNKSSKNKSEKVEKKERFVTCDCPEPHPLLQGNEQN